MKAAAVFSPLESDDRGLDQPRREEIKRRGRRERERRRRMPKTRERNREIGGEGMNGGEGGKERGAGKKIREEKTIKKEKRRASNEILNEEEEDG